MCLNICIYRHVEIIHVMKNLNKAMNMKRNLTGARYEYGKRQNDVLVLFLNAKRLLLAFFYFCRLPFCAMHGKFDLLVGRVKTPLDLRPFNCLAPRNIQLSVLCKAVDCLENGGTSALSKIDLDVWLKHAFQASRGKFVEIWRFLSLRWCFHLSEATEIYLIKLTTDVEPENALL